MNKETIKQSLISLCEKAIQDIFSKYPSGSIANLLTPFEVPIQKPNHIQIVYRGMYNWNEIIENLYGNEYENYPAPDVLKSFLESVNYFGKDPALPPIYTFKVSGLLTQMIFSKETDVINYTMPDLTDMAEQLSQMIVTDKRKHVFMALLNGVEFETPIFHENITFFTPSIDERKTLFIAAQRNTNFFNKQHFNEGKYGYLHCNSIVKIDLEVPYLGEKNQSKEQSTYINNSLLALRVLHYEPVEIITKIYGDDFPFFSPATFNLKKVIGFTKQDFFNKDNIDLINIFLHDQASTKEFGFIISRLGEIAKHKDHNFQVFNYISICEAIVVQTNEGELNFKLALYVAILTDGCEGKTKKEIFKFMKKCYGLRSKIAHCSPIKEKDFLNEEDLRLLRKIVHSLCIQTLTSSLPLMRDKALDLILEAETAKDAKV